MHARKRQSGVTLLEMAIAVAVTSSLIGVVLTIGVETASFASYADEDFSAQFEANRAFDSIAAVLRKTGWSTAGGVTYPRVTNGGTELSFRLLEDLDGNGFPFEATTGDLEWGATAYTFRNDASTEMLGAYDGLTELRTLGRFVNSVEFETVTENPALHRMELRVRVTTSRAASDGTVISYTAEGSVHMRN